MAEPTRREKHWFFGPVLEQKSKFFQLIIASLSINLFALISAFYILTVYDRVIPNDTLDSLIYLTGGMLAVILFDFLMKVVRGIVTDQAGIEIDKEVAASFFDHISRNEKLIGKQSTGSLSTTIKEFDNLKDVMASATLVAFADLPFILIFLVVLYLIGGPIAAVPGMIVIIVLIGGLAIQPIIRRMSAHASDDGKSKQSVLIEMISGLETLKTLRGINLLEKRWSESVQKQGEAVLKSRFWNQLLSNFAQSGQQLSQVGIIVYGVLLIMSADLTMGALIACVILSGRTLAPLGQITNLLGRLNQAMVAYSSLQQLFSQKSIEKSSQNYVRHERLDSSIQIRNLSLTYEGANKPALENLNLNIKAGEKIAVLGKIGSGKTTLIKIITGLVSPSSGNVKAGGVELSNLHPDDIRKTISVCLQTPLLFSGTVKENLLLGNPEASDEEIIAASKLTGVDRIVDELPKGYATQLNEKGEMLSGGQRQAITLTRTLINNPDILLLDEPTSSMDTQTEKFVLENLKTWIKTKTVLVATHRGQLLELADRVVVIDSGKIVADDKKEAILKKTQGTTSS